LECNDTIAGVVHIYLELDVHKCREPPSVNITLQLDVFDYKYSWSHDFIGNVAFFLPNFSLSLDFLPAPVQVIVEAHVYRRSNRDIHAAAAIEPVLVFPGGNVSSLFKIDLVDGDKYPVNTSDCYGPANCYGNCSNNSSCLLGEDGWVCYDCPTSCLPEDPSQPVCGSDLVSYDSECSMRIKGCDDSKALRALYPGKCSSTPPVTVLKEWPKSLENLPPVTQQFIQVAVVFLSVSVSENFVSSVLIQMPSYFSDKLTDTLGYQVVVPEITTSSSSTPTDGNIVLNVTVYAHRDIHIVKGRELLQDIQENTDTLETVLNVQNLQGSLSYGASTTVKRQDSSSSSSSTTAIVVGVVVPLVALAVIAVILGFIWHKKRRASEDSFTLSTSDQLESKYS
jgi:hypothetical protein